MATYENGQFNINLIFQQFCRLVGKKQPQNTSIQKVILFIALFLRKLTVKIRNGSN